jgi:hypothetical protein
MLELASYLGRLENRLLKRLIPSLSMLNWLART